jgi:ADP-ribose pyrophosphatase
VVEPGGVRAVREILRHPGSAVVVARRSNGDILLIRQYRHAAKAKLWEVVAGTLDPGESPRQTAERELAEEAGLGARRWKPLGCFYPSPGLMDERMWFYLAEDLVPRTAPADADERITRRWFPPAAVDRMIRRGTIRDAKTALALFLMSRA